MSVKRNTLYAAVLTSVLAVLLFSCMAAAREGAETGVELSMNVLIPSLFPFMVMSNLVVDMGLSRRAGKALEAVTRRVFALPGSAGAVLIMSMIGGFPAGAAGIAALRDSGEINEAQAHRMLMFCVNGGPAFTITAVGGGMIGSYKCGALIFAANVLAALTLGAVLSFGHRGEKGGGASAENESDLSSRFVNSVAKAGGAMLIACAMVVFFSALTGALGALPLNPSVKTAVGIILEVTVGAKTAAQFGVPAAAACIGFGGISVLLQITAVFGGRVKLLRLILCRIAAAALSFLYARLLTAAFPSVTDVFSNATPKWGGTVNGAGAALCLAFMAVTLVLSVSNKAACEKGKTVVQYKGNRF